MQLYNLYCKAMFLVAKRYVKDTFLAEDVMQDAFIKAFKNINSYKGEVAFGAWLKKIVINQSIDELKKKKLDTISINQVVEDKIDVENEDWEVDDKISAEEIVKTINSLQEKYRIVLTLYLLEGYDHEEISEILKIPVTTSRSHLHRGKIKLQTLLRQSNYGEGYKKYY